MSRSDNSSTRSAEFSSPKTRSQIRRGVIELNSSETLVPSYTRNYFVRKIRSVLPTTPRRKRAAVLQLIDRDPDLRGLLPGFKQHKLFEHLTQNSLTFIQRLNAISQTKDLVAAKSMRRGCAYLRASDLAGRDALPCYARTAVHSQMLRFLIGHTLQETHSQRWVTLCQMMGASSRARPLQSQACGVLFMATLARACGTRL